MIFAHGVGSRGDLPIPFWQFAWAAVAALAISFVALGVLWKQPRLAVAAEGRVVEALRRPTDVLAAVLRGVFLVLFVVTLGAALFGNLAPRANIAPVGIYVAFWVGLQFLIVAIGDVWTRVSPFDTIVAAVERLRGGRADSGDAGPAWSHLLAPAAMFGFLFLELLHPSGSEPRVLGWAMVIYSVVMIAAGITWGREWLREGETFSVLFALLAAMSPVYRTESGGLGLRWPIAGLSDVPMNHTQLAVVLLVLGGTTFDGFGESKIWTDLVGRRNGWDDIGIGVVGLLFSIMVVAMLYEFAVRFTAETTNSDLVDARLAFGPSLVPIVFGYTVAHYAQLLVDEIQTFTFRLSDPFGKSWNLFGTSDNYINYNVISVDLIAWIQVLAIVVGHIAAVTVAHDRAVERYEARGALQSQYAMLFVMVLYSVVGLWLLMNA